MCQFLLENGANANYQTIFNNTCLQIAQRNNLSEIKALLIKHGAKYVSSYIWIDSTAEFEQSIKTGPWKSSAKGGISL
jgi:hypothetical protein